MVFIFGLGFSTKASAAMYYVDSASSGGDGTTTATSGEHAAFATISATNAGTYNSGDSILFKRGDTWRIDATLALSTAGITVGAYGTGNKPELWGSIDGKTLTWTDQGSNLWSTPITVTANDADHGNILWLRIATADVDASFWNYTKRDTNHVNINGATKMFAVEGSYPNQTLWVYGSSNPATWPILEIPVLENIIFMNSQITFNDIVAKYANYDIWSGEQADITLNRVEAYYFYGGSTANGITNHNVGSSTTVNDSVCLYGSGPAIAFGGSGPITVEVNDSEMGFANKGFAPGTTGTFVLNRCNIHNTAGIGIDGIGGLTVNSCKISTTGNYGIYSASGTGIAYNTTIYSPTTYGIYVAGTANLTLKNSIIYGTDGPALRLDATATYTGDNNIFWRDTNSTMTRFGATLYNRDNFSNYQTAVSPQDANSLATDPLFVSSSDFTLQNSSPAINAGVNVDLTTDYASNPIYGLPDIGAFEYQPPYTSGTNEIDVGAGARIYGDGKFENINSTSGTTADLSVVPQGSQTTKWLDITKADDESSILWESNHKKWKESSTTLGATNTLHTIGDLTVGKSYTLTIDGNPASEDPTTGNISSSDCVNSICTADGTGQIIFTYTGGYSEHTFDIDDDIPPVITISSPETSDTVSGDDTIIFTDTEPTDPECSVDNSAWVNCTSAATSFSALTNWDDISESDTLTLYMRDADASGNQGTASVSNLMKADMQAPVRSAGSPSEVLSSGTTSTTLNLTTSESATCKYSTASGTAYASMTESFTTSNGTAHTKNISGLSSGNSYSYYVRCQDLSENANDTDYLISFSIASVESNDENTDEDNDDEKDLNIHSVKA
ncbi:MAG TPA: right-handed parallel beta-helix repeat-containing protein, partial [Candidatus Kapabacteria bacterium]|nr:right-handed parallel beta-helix repeat-containing protein [Candidatus Kapabacteria bacterium]